MASPTPHNQSIKLRARRPTSPASSSASSECTPLFMASKLTRKDRGSMSPIANSAPRKKCWRSEPNTQMQDDDIASESATWKVINREISEWKNVCLTGRPSWWSQASRWTQGWASKTGRGDAHTVPLWHRNLYDAYRPDKVYDEQRRAVTDGYLDDENKVQDLAHLIAIQLLSTCFTLSPEYVSSYKSPGYPRFSAATPTGIPDPRLISSLRLHTESRYSPSFGHEARNTSPTYRRQGAYDGPSRATSRGSSSCRNSADLGVSTKTSRERKSRRYPHILERSSDNCSGDGSMELDDLNNITPIITSKHDIDQECTRLDVSTVSAINSKTCFLPRNKLGIQASNSSRWVTGIFRRCMSDDLRAHGYSQTPDPPNYRALQSVIRSEPHHICIQPVKESIVNRWQTVRRRLGYGLGHVNHELLNGRASPTLSKSTSSKPIPVEQSPGSPVFSSDGKERRRQARECSDFHSDSTDSNPLSHTPEHGLDSGFGSPPNAVHFCQDVPRRKYLGAAEAIATALAGSGLTTAIPPCFTPPNSQIPSRISSPKTAGTDSLDPRRDLGLLSDLTTSNSQLSNSVPTTFTYRYSERRHKRSNLSEICTPEDVEDKAVLKRLANSLAIPREEAGLKPATSEILSQPTEPEPDVKAPSIHQILSITMIPTSRVKEEDIPGLRPLPEAKARRPSIIRTSTSGTQVFTPSEDGIELDGLPTGPPSEVWDGERQGKKRKQRSYL